MFLNIVYGITLFVIHHASEFGIMKIMFTKVTQWDILKKVKDVE